MCSGLGWAWSFFSTLTNSSCRLILPEESFSHLQVCSVALLQGGELVAHGSESQMTARIKSVSHRDLLRRNVLQVFYLSSRVRSPRGNDGV